MALIEADSTVTASETQSQATWGLDRIDQRALPLSSSFTYAGTGAGATAYIIDSGIRTTHVEFEGRAHYGTDTVGDGRRGQDCNGHGTHIAGTVGGKTHGVAKKVRLTWCAAQLPGFGDDLRRAGRGRAGHEKRSEAGGRQRTGDYDYHPNESWFYAGAGWHHGCAAGPTGTDFDLYLERWNGTAWVTVASGPSTASKESVSYNGAAGYYIWKVLSYSGSGSYEGGFKRP